MEELDGIASARALAAGRADLVAAVQLVEDQFLGVRGRERRPDDLRAMLVKPLGHAEQVVRGVVQVRQDECPCAARCVTR